MSDTNRVVQPQKMVRGLKFRIKEEGGLYYLCRKTEGLISCTVTANEIHCNFVAVKIDNFQMKMCYFSCFCTKGDSKGSELHGLVTL